jgi:hypothetical protein
MKNKLFGTTLIVLIMFAFTACDDGLREDEASFSMNGTKAGMDYSYYFSNSSSYAVTVTFVGKGISKTLPSNSGKTTVIMTASTSSMTVKYSPSSKVRHSNASMAGTTKFYDR